MITRLVAAYHAFWEAVARSLGVFEDDACTAEPCPVCGACDACLDFHGYTGRGCTSDNCPELLED